MRWIPFLILAYVTLVVQTSLVNLLAFGAGAAGTVQPDLLALTAAFVATFARTGLDAMLAAWGLGLALDLTTGMAVGVMPITFVLAAGAVFRARDALFRDRFWARFMLTLLFCLLAHPLWVTIQSILSWGAMSWGDYGRAMLQAFLISVYTAAVAPPVQWALAKLEPVLFGAPAGRSRR